MEDGAERENGVSQFFLRLIKTLFSIYDFISYPFYALFFSADSNPSPQIYATPISKSDSEITYKAKSRTTKELEAFNAANLYTMVDCWNFAVGLHGSKDCLGTRKILRQVDEIQPDGKVFKKCEMGSYSWISFNEVDELSNSFALGLKILGLQERANICIFAESKAEWMISALSCFKNGNPLVTLYANLGEDAIVHGVNQTNVNFLITTHELLPKLKNVLLRSSSLTTLIYFQDQIDETTTEGYKNNVRLFSYSQVLEIGAKGSSSSSFSPPRLTPTEPAIIMYTSGSTGVPKGVILPHESLLATIKAFHVVVQDPNPSDTYLAYLPLAHIYELLSEMTMLIQGIRVGYSSPNTMIDKSTKIMRGSRGDSFVLKPTLLCAVPLVLDRIYKGIQESVASKGGAFLISLLNLCILYKSKARQRGEKTPVLDALFFSSMKNIVGGQVRFIVSGGAPLLPKIHDFVCCALNVTIHQGYGLTESCSSATVMGREDLSTGRVGPPCQGVLIRLINWEEGNYRVTDTPNPRGEIVIGGKNVALGYYQLPEKTLEDFFVDENGVRWFKSGDIGEFAKDGTLKIIDRKKDLVKLQYGEYVSLGKVETVLKVHSLVENICAYGDSNQTYCVALILPHRDKILAYASKIGIEIPVRDESSTEEEEEKDYQALLRNSTLNARLLKELRAVGSTTGLEKFELPGAISLVSEAWTPESGLVTSAFKLKRVVIERFYKEKLQAMYEASSSPVF